MTTLTDRPNSALVVIDVQNGVVADAHDRDAVVARIVERVDRARSEAVPVVWVQHSSSDLVRESTHWEIVPELSPAGGEPTVHKTYGDAFETPTSRRCGAHGRHGSGGGRRSRRRQHPGRS